MAVSVKQFVQNLVASGLMTADELRAFRAKLPPQLLHLTAEGLARELVRQGKLTTYQAGRIYESKHRGLILGNYIILELIGSGGMGDVYKAEHRRMKRPVVVKILHAELTSSDVALKRFQREVEAAAKLSHQNIVTAFDADEDNGIYFLVMEYVEGKDLGSLVSHHGPLDVEVALDYVIQAAKGIAYAHSCGVIHRDIKPSNLLVDTSGVVRVLDMGLARIESPFGPQEEHEENDDEDSLTQANQIVGTVDYMSPEQADNSMIVDRRSDIYSLGCTFHRLLVGKAPYKGKSTIQTLLAHRSQPVPSLRATRPEIPERLDLVFQRMVAKSPEDRYATMEQVVQQLERRRRDMRSGLAGGGSRDTPGGPPPEKSSRPVHGEATDVFQVEEDTRSTIITSAQAIVNRREPAVGIDLGTTYSAVAFLDELGRPQTLPNAEGDKTTPSVLLFENGEVVVGKEAIKAMATEMDCIAECAKRDLGLRRFHKQLVGRDFPPESLEAWVLNKLRADAWKSIGRFQKVVITVPAYFDEVRRKATQDAGYMAGFDVMDIINEPTSAAVAFGFQQGYLRQQSDAVRPQRILVYDLGGGTFDVTVMEVGGIDFVALATDGDVRLGGRDWDQRLVDFVAEEFIRTHRIDPREDANTHGRLWRECEDAKRTLSARSRTHIACDYRGNALRVAVTRKQFENMTQDLLDRTAFTTEQTIQAARLRWSDIDRVLLVGGSTRMPAVFNMLKQMSGREPDCSISPDEAVAHGAALHAGLLLDLHEGKKPRFTIKNVNSHSLGVAAVDPLTKRKQTAVLIPRNTPLPVTAKRIFTTSKDGQRSVLVQIVEGETESPDDCVQIGRCTVRDLPPNLPAHTPVEVRFRYEENGRLTVQVRVAGTDKDLRHEIVRENALTWEQLNQWRQRISGLPPAEEGSSDGSKSTELMQYTTSG